MTRRGYLLAIACYLLIPVVVIAGSGLHQLIDPEMARGHADYARDYRLLDRARLGALMVAAALAVVLWLSTCYLVLRARQRSLGWILLAAAGPLGLMGLVMLDDRSPAPGDLHQRFVRKLERPWRVVLEVAVVVSAWLVADETVAIKRELMIRYESFSTGTPVEAIVAQQNASSGMWAFGEGLQEMYLAVLICLLWPVLFNLAARLRPRGNAAGD